jgi:hypothetical protein
MKILARMRLRKHRRVTGHRRVHFTNEAGKVIGMGCHDCRRMYWTDERYDAVLTCALDMVPRKIIDPERKALEQCPAS